MEHDKESLVRKEGIVVGRIIVSWKMQQLLNICMLRKTADVGARTMTSRDVFIQQVGRSVCSVPKNEMDIDK